MMSNEERRKLPRLPVDIEITYRLQESAVPEAPVAQSRDVSMGGLGVVLLERCEPGSLVELTMVMPDSNRAVMATGRILHSEPYGIGGETTYDTGIEFVAINDSDRGEIERLMATDSSQPAQ